LRDGRHPQGRPRRGTGGRRHRQQEMTDMRRLLSVLALAAALAPFVPVAAQAPAVRSTGFHNVHLRVADPAAAADWYIKNLGATKAPAPFSVAFGRTLVERGA